MMKFFKTFFIAIISFLMIVVGCAKLDNNYHSNSLPVNERGEYAIMFSNPITKAAVVTTSSAGYDEFSLYAWNSNDEVIMNPFTVQADGTSVYKYENVNGQELQYFKKNAESYSFIGVIPTTTATLNNGSVKVGVESFVVDDKRAEGNGVKEDSPKEFLWARADVEKANYSQTVTLPFKHGNALLYLGFISDDGNTKILDYVPERTTPGTTIPNPQNSKLDGTAWARTSTAVGAVIDQDDIDYINGLFTYNSSLVFTYGDGTEIPATEGYITGYFQEALGIKDYLISKHPELSGVSDTFMNSFANFYLIHIEKSGNEVCGWFYNKKKGSVSSVTTYTETTTPGTTIPAIEGIRVFSAKEDATDGYAHVKHTLTADATVATGLTFDNRNTSSDVIQFSLPTVNVPVGTTEAQAVYSPTTFYAIPGDTGLTHFVVKVSYEYKGTKVYDVRVPITLPSAGLEAGKYYKYIINITSTGNGTNDPGEADPEKDDIDIVDNPIKVTIDVTDYENGDTQIITI